MNMRNMILSAAIGLGTLASMAAEQTFSQPAVGQSAPDFSLTTGDGSQVSLKDYRGKWVVLYFYPKDFTSGCNGSVAAEAGRRYTPSPDAASYRSRSGEHL
jgi:peroxiredoxin Q/BCP